MKYFIIVRTNDQKVLLRLYLTEIHRDLTFGAYKPLFSTRTRTERHR